MGKRGLWRVFPHFPALFGSHRDLPLRGCSQCSGQPDVLAGKRQSGQQRGQCGRDKLRTGKRSDMRNNGLHLLRPTTYKLGDTWELLQQLPGDHSHISAFVLWLPPGAGEICVHPSFLPWMKWEIMWKQEDLPSGRGSQELTKQRHLLRYPLGENRCWE